MALSRPQPAFPPQVFTFKDGVPPRDIEAHLASRATLLRLLVEDPVVLNLFHTFGGSQSKSETPLWDIAGLTAQLADMFAQECGWRDRGHMYREPDIHDETLSPHCESFDASVMAFPWHRLSTFKAAAEGLVHETWSLPRHHPRERWSWLAADLMRHFVLALEGTLLGRGHIVIFAQHEPTPSIEVSFSSRPGESADEARRRLKAWYEESDAALGPTPKPRHDGTILDAPRLQRDVAWFYRHLLKGEHESMRKLAREYAEAAKASGTTLSVDQHGTVQAGIKRARRLLSHIPA